MKGYLMVKVYIEFNPKSITKPNGLVDYSFR